MAVPPFTKSPPELVERFDAAAGRHPDAQRRKMFGYPALFVGGNLATGLFADTWIVRLGPTDIDALVALRGSALRAGPGSTVIGAALLQALFAEVAARLAAEGAPPIWLSSNMPGAEAHNRELLDRYRPLNPHL